LLQRGADVDVLNKANKTAAELASENGEAEVAKFIAEYKADANIRNKIRSSTLDIAQFGADEDGKDKGNAPLHAAAAEGNIDVVKSLLEQGVDVDSCNEDNRTPLHRAAYKGNVDVVRLLIERGAEVDLRDKFGWIPLHSASRYGHLEVSRILINHGTNVNARQRNHWTPIHFSARNGYLEIAKLLLEHGADVLAVSDR
jgi:ankyrin repeat protein